MRLLPTTRSLVRLGVCCLFALASACRADDLTDVVAKAFQARLPDEAVSVKDADELVVTGKTRSSISRSTSRATPA